MGFMTKLMAGYHRARNEVILKAAEKKGRVANGYLIFTATGRTERDVLMDNGWDMVQQEVSERGTWISLWLMRRRING